MGSRAVYTFIDDRDEYHVYRQHDTYPEDSKHYIKEALDHAWPLPRFEADEFAAAFVCAAKLANTQMIQKFAELYGKDTVRRSGGGIYLTQDWNNHGDLEFRYEISYDSDNSDLWVEVYEVSQDYKTINGMRKFVSSSKLLWEGTLTDMFDKYKDEE